MTQLWLTNLNFCEACLVNTFNTYVVYSGDALPYPSCNTSTFLRVPLKQMISCCQTHLHTKTTTKNNNLQHQLSQRNVSLPKANVVYATPSSTQTGTVCRNEPSAMATPSGRCRLLSIHLSPMATLGSMVQYSTTDSPPITVLQARS